MTVSGHGNNEFSGRISSGGSDIEGEEGEHEARIERQFRNQERQQAYANLFNRDYFDPALEAVPATAPPPSTSIRASAPPTSTPALPPACRCTRCPPFRPASRLSRPGTTTMSPASQTASPSEPTPTAPAPSAAPVRRRLQRYVPLLRRRAIQRRFRRPGLSQLSIGRFGSSQWGLEAPAASGW